MFFKNIFSYTYILNYFYCRFGKHLEDVTNRLSVKICKSAEKFKYIARFPSYKGCHIINKDMVITYSRERDVKITKPFIVGFAILELSKDYMFRSYYNIFEPNLKNIKLLFSDTDSLLFSFKTENRFNDMKKLDYIFDFSNYDEKHFMYNDCHKNKLGYFKDEMQGNDILEFIGNN